MRTSLEKLRQRIVRKDPAKLRRLAVNILVSTAFIDLILFAWIARNIVTDKAVLYAETETPYSLGTSTYALLDELRSRGDEPVVISSVNRRLFSVSGYIVSIGKDTIQVYEYSDPIQKSLDKNRISRQYSAGATRWSMWRDKVHVYESPDLIVFYMGNDQMVLSDLDGIKSLQYRSQAHIVGPAVSDLTNHLHI